MALHDAWKYTVYPAITEFRRLPEDRKVITAMQSDACMLFYDTHLKAIYCTFSSLLI